MEDSILGIGANYRKVFLVACHNDIHLLTDVFTDSCSKKVCFLNRKHCTIHFQTLSNTTYMSGGGVMCRGVYPGLSARIIKL